MTTVKALDTKDLQQRVQQMYREVADHPHQEFHFETGRALAERLGYPATELDAIPAAAIDSFAGVGYYLDLAAIAPATRSWTWAAGRAWTPSSRRRRPGRMVA